MEIHKFFTYVFSLYSATDAYPFLFPFERLQKSFAEVFFCHTYQILRKAGESMKSSIIKSKDELPMFLTVMDMAALLGISRSSAYELAAEEGFPKLKLVPGRVIIPRDGLLEWLDSQMSFEKNS